MKKVKHDSVGVNHSLRRILRLIHAVFADSRRTVELFGLIGERREASTKSKKRRFLSPSSQTNGLLTKRLSLKGSASKQNRRATTPLYVPSVFWVVGKLLELKMPQNLGPLLMRENQRLALPVRPKSKDEAKEPLKRGPDNRSEHSASRIKHPEHRLQV